MNELQPDQRARTYYPCPNTMCVVLPGSKVSDSWMDTSLAHTKAQSITRVNNSQCICIQGHLPCQYFQRVPRATAYCNCSRL